MPTSAARLKPFTDEVRASDALGRSELLRRLFDFLEVRSEHGASPKEVEVAMEVFERPSSFDGARDTIVRVYIHKLRRRLDAFYAAGVAGEERLFVPSGEYRLALKPREASAAAAPLAPEVPPPPPRGSVRRWRWIVGVMVGLQAARLIVIAALTHRSPAQAELEAVRAEPIWSGFLRSPYPTLFVVGDYYIFGDSQDGGMDVSRLVREYAVNSREDLAAFLLEHPKEVGHYVDVDLRYLPVASAFALRDVLPIFAGRTPAARTRVILASDLTPTMMKNANIVFIGYLSGLGPLRDVVFAGSRFSIGATFDELVDNQGKKHFFAQGSEESPKGSIYRDYGYFSTFDGPGGNHFAILAGTRDVAVMQTAEAATSLANLKTLMHQTHAPSGIEALYAVNGMGSLNFDGKLLSASRLNTAKIWGVETTFGPRGPH